MALSFQDKIRPVQVTANQDKTKPVQKSSSNLSFQSKIRPVTTPAPAPVVTPAQPEKKEGGGMLKSLISAPATMLARPFQAAESLGETIGRGDSVEQMTELAKKKTEADLKIIKLRNEKRARGEDTTHLDNYIKTMNDPNNNPATKYLSEVGNYKPSIGENSDIIAPAPENWKDVKKDVGRGIETVALGVGSPLAAGAAFGVGSSLEQGNDFLSTQTLISAATGMAAAKVLSIIGKPIFNKAGQIIGKVTPESLKVLASKGTGAIQSALKDYHMLGGIMEPTAAKIQSRAALFDKTINKGASTLWKGVGKQYPGFTVEGQKERAFESNKRMFTDAMEKNKGAYQNARAMNERAKKDNIDFGDLLNEEGINLAEYVDDGKFQTKSGLTEKVRALPGERAGEMNNYLKGINGSVRNVPQQQIRDQLIKEIKSIPSSQIDPLDRIKLTNMAEKMPYENSYNPEGLNNAKIVAGGKAKYDPKTGKVPDAITAKFHDIEQRVFGKNLRSVTESLPDGGGKYVDNYLKAQEKIYKLADILEQFDKKPIPKTWLRKTSEIMAKAAGATVGYGAGGPIGGITGYHSVGQFFKSMADAPGPLKKAAFARLIKQNPQAVQEIAAEAERIWGMKISNIGKGLSLPGPSATTAPELSALQNERGAVEMGYTPKPLTPAEISGNAATQNIRADINSATSKTTPKRLFGTVAGQEPLITPNRFGAPNVEKNMTSDFRQKINTNISPEDAEVLKIVNRKDIEKWLGGKTLRQAPGDQAAFEAALKQPVDETIMKNLTGSNVSTEALPPVHLTVDQVAELKSLLNTYKNSIGGNIKKQALEKIAKMANELEEKGVYGLKEMMHKILFG